MRTQRGCWSREWTIDFDARGTHSKDAKRAPSLLSDQAADSEVRNYFSERVDVVWHDLPFKYFCASCCRHDAEDELRRRGIPFMRTWRRYFGHQTTSYLQEEATFLSVDWRC